MNLKNLFNFNFMMQNLKKSRVVLAVFVGLMPILNTIILIMMLSTNNNYVMDFKEISILSLVGIYFFPVVISICLFNYIYKKKSVDFVGSMPISRKSIYITNFITGIIIIIWMLIMNIILTSIVMYIFKSPISIMMLIDYFFIFLLIYIFVFSANLIAVSISGNVITQLVVMLLILFFVPYVSIYTDYMLNQSTEYKLVVECNNKECLPENYSCYEDKECLSNLKENKYTNVINLKEKNNYTTPFGLLYGSFMEDDDIVTNISILKMIFLSIIYTIIGYFLFLRRKMEVCETSFNNIHIHNIVKSLTLVPIVTLAYNIFSRASLIVIIFFVVLMLIYYFIYELITRKSITNIKLLFIYFFITLIVITSSCMLIDNNDRKDVLVNATDIESVYINVSAYKKNTSKIYLDDEDLISLVTTSLIESYENPTKSFQISMKTKDNKEYSAWFSVNDDIYNKIIDILESNQEYVNQYKNIELDNIYALKIGTRLFSIKEGHEYLNNIKKIMKDMSLKDYLELNDKYYFLDDNYRNYGINIYSYNNHDKNELIISPYISYDLLNMVGNINNKYLFNDIDLIIPNNYYLYYENSYLDNNYKMNYYVLKSAKNEIYNFILDNKDEVIDYKAEYISFRIELNNNTYIYTTNKVDEILEILDNKYLEIKDTEEYINNTKGRYYD